MHPDLAFLGSGGLDAEAGITDHYPDDVASRRALLRNAGRAYVLAGSTQHGPLAPFKVCGLGAFGGVITDKICDARLADALHRAGVEVLRGAAD